MRRLRQMPRSLGRARARAALAAAQAKQNKRIKALFALIEMLEMHKDALQIESYEVLPYGSCESSRGVVLAFAA